MSLPPFVETVVVGAGQAGLCMSWELSRADRPHVVLEARSELGGGWRDRWDNFQLVTPNWSASFPEFAYDGSDPDGYMPRDSIAARVARYAEVVGAPVRLNARVTKMSARADGGFQLETTDGPVRAETVIVAIGSFHEPRMPAIAAAMPDNVLQLHSHHYRREANLPAGGVLIVGSGQSGAQLAEELWEAGRRVYLSTGTAGRMPRRYRGHDSFFWLFELANRGEAFGLGLPTVDMLPSPAARLMGNPAWSGHGGGRDTNLREFAARGMTLLGRIQAVEGRRLTLAPDLPANLARADAFFDERWRSLVDRYIEAAGMEAPADDRQQFDFEPPLLEELDLGSAGISTVLWTTGYRLNYDWIDLPIFDEFGWPKQRRGVTEVPGLYFTGLIWQHNTLSATLAGASMEARHVARAMGLTEPVAGEAIGAPVPSPERA